MDRHIRALRKEELLETDSQDAPPATEPMTWFDEDNAERVVSWMVAADKRSPVVLVGAGFSLNALDRRSLAPATREQAPLWNDVVTRLAIDLGVSDRQYDAPTLFEMYREALGEAKLRDALRATVADSDLVPGKAHRALAEFPCEAIVTTNCLDTLLDAACVGWNRIVLDADLSSSGARRELIYLHGHRDFSDSWVMTRSQYEDFARRKPVVAARVRQLLAQHPWLVLGFGMTDPNFHAITRLIGLEMGGHQPLSLAIMRDSPTAAERQHWRRLGFEIATPAARAVKDRPFGDFLSWIIPKLVTSYSATSAAAASYINRGNSKAVKLERFREVFPIPIVDRKTALDEWTKQLKHLLSTAEQEDAKTAARAAGQAIWGPAVATKVGPDSTTPRMNADLPARVLASDLFTGLDIAPRFRPLASFEEVQWLATLTGSGLDAELAKHFEWALNHHLFEVSPRELPLEVIAIRLSKRAGWPAERMEALTRAGLASTRKYGRAEVEALLEREATALGLSLAKIADGPVQAHLASAKKGHDAYMDAKFRKAAERYGEAARQAASLRLDFEEWVYSVGRLHALGRLTTPSLARSGQRPRVVFDNDLRKKAAAETNVEELERRSTVAEWRRRADAQSLAVLSEVVDALHDESRFRESGGDGRRYGGRGQGLWRSLRDLETAHAPPTLRQRYSGPLLELLDATEAAFVVATSSKSREWLESILAEPVESQKARQIRDRTLIDFVLQNPDELSVTGRVSRIEWLRELRGVFRVGDNDRALDWLTRASADAGMGFKETAWGSQAVGADCWRAFSTMAQWATPALACNAASNLVDRFRSSHWDAAKALYDLPWHRWHPLEPVTAKKFFEVLTKTLPNVTTTKGLGARSGSDYALFTLYRMLEAGLLPDTLAGNFRWEALMARVREEPTTMAAEHKRAAFLVEGKLAESTPASPDIAELFFRWFPPTALEGQAAVDPETDRERWATLADYAGRSSRLLLALRSEVHRLLDAEDAIRHYELNPYRSYSAIALLAEGMKRLKGDRPRVGAFLIRLLRVEASGLSGISEVLRFAWWKPGEWDDLMNLVLSACGGAAPTHNEADPGAATRRQLAVLDLFGELPKSNDIEVYSPVVWHAVQGLALASVTDSRPLVANHAAFAVAKAARHIKTDAEASLYAAALGRIARDPRVVVSSAIADAGPGLASRALSQVVRDAARAAVALQEKDDNAQIATLLGWAKASVRASVPNVARSRPHGRSKRQSKRR